LPVTLGMDIEDLQNRIVDIGNKYFLQRIGQLKEFWRDKLSYLEV